jgi:mannosyltransferase
MAEQSVAYVPAIPRGRIPWFLVAGAAGYAVNLAVYAAALPLTDYRLAAVTAFLVSVATTFALNRRFTFSVRGGRVRRQAARYLVVAVVAFGVNLAVLDLLVRAAGVRQLPAGAIAVLIAAPVNYAGQRRWAFADVAPAHWPVVVALGGIVALAAGLRLWGLGHEGLWYDEGMTAWLVRGTPGQLLEGIPKTESTPPLFYLLTWCWVHAFGESVAGLRSVAAIAGILTVPATFLAARALAGARVGLVAALLVAVNPMLVWFARDARAYALLGLLVATSLWLLVRARDEPRAGRLTAWAVVAALALWTHYFAVFVVVPEAALLLLGAPRRDLVPRLLAIGAVGVAGASLLGFVQRQRGAHTLYFTHTPLAGRVGQTAREFAVGFTPPARTAALVVAAAVAVLAVGLVVARGTRAERRAALLAGAIAVTAVGLPLALAAAGTDYFDARNVIGALVPVVLVVAAGLGAARAGAVGLVAAAVLAVSGVALVHAMATDGQAQRPDLAAVAAALRRPAVAGPRAILIRGRSSWAVQLRFYLPPAWWVPQRGAAVREIDALRRVPDARECPNETTWGAFCDIAPQPPLPRPPARGFRAAGRQRVAGFEIARYVASKPVSIHPRRPFGAVRPLPGAPRRMLLVGLRGPAVPT